MKWVTFYGNAQSKVLPAPATYAKDLTLRYPIYAPFNGNKIRITLDNFCSDNQVTIDRVTIGFTDGLNDKTLNMIDVTFNGSNKATMAPHESIISDEISLDVKANSFLSITMYMSDYTDLTSGVDIIGPLSKGYFGYGDYTHSNKLDINKSKSTSWVYFLANVDIYTENSNNCIICYGDSITSQAWPDYMMLALKEKGINNLCVIRKAVSGTRILREYDCITYQSYGKKGSNRFNHEIGSVSGAKYLIIDHGINDIIHPVGVETNIFRPWSDMPELEDLKTGIEYYVNEAKKYNLDIFMATLTPIYGWRTYAPFRESLKNDFNGYLNTYKCIDFSNEVSDFIDSSYRFKEGFNSGDSLHPSQKAYEAMGKLACKKIIENEN